jgi:polyisoprenoid-binding protein YceI
MKMLLSLGMICISILGAAQGKFYTKTGKISFYSATSLENIEAINKSAIALLDTKTGDIQLSVQMKGFEFKKALMQEHFNSEYIESDKFPKAVFKGTVVNNAAINYAADGSYPAKVKGQLTLHGQSKDVEANGSIVVKGCKVSIAAVFAVVVDDFKISIPRMYRDNIAKSVRVTIDCPLAAL